MQYFRIDYKSLHGQFGSSYRMCNSMNNLVKLVLNIDAAIDRYLNAVATPASQLEIAFR